MHNLHGQFLGFHFFFYAFKCLLWFLSFYFWGYFVQYFCAHKRYSFSSIVHKIHQRQRKVWKMMQEVIHIVPCIKRTPFQQICFQWLLPKDVYNLFTLTLFRMGLFGAAHGWGRGHPTMMKLSTIIPYPKNIQKIYESRNTLLSSTDISIFFTRNQQILLSANFAMSRNTDIDCVLIHNF